MRIHEDRPVLEYGAAIDDAQVFAILLHGRGGSAEDMIGMAQRLVTPGVKAAFLAPQAAGGSWYPQRFLALLSQNEPFLGSALQSVNQIIGGLSGRRVAPARILLAGFSQGACLALEFAARNPDSYAGVVGFSGALIGPPGTERRSSGLFPKTPVFLGCGDRDHHIPVASVHESAGIFRQMGADVTERIYPNMPHTINEDELAMLADLVSRAAKQV
jgi:predicted esterase